MLTDKEWELFTPYFTDAIKKIQLHRAEHNCSLKEATEKGFGQLDLYEHITGFKETNLNAIHHHRLSLYGSPCQVCGKPLRTPLARYCANCGVEKHHER